MYNTSATIDNLIRSNGRTFRAKLSTDHVDITAIADLKYSAASQNGDNINIGATCSRMITANILDSSVSLLNQEYQLYIGILNVDEITYIPFGSFKIKKADKQGTGISIEAYDQLYYKAEIAYFSTLTYPSNTLSILDEISELTGIQIDKSGLSSVLIETKPEGYTCREMIGFIAALYGKFATMGRDDILCFKFYADADYIVNIDFVDEPCVNEVDSTINSITVAVDTSTTLSCGNGNVNISFSNPFYNDTILEDVFSLLDGFTYRAGTYKLRLGDPRFDVWDVLTFIENSTTYKIPCMNIEMMFDGGVSTDITAVGKSETEELVDFKGPTTKKIERVYEDLVLINQALINKLDVNVANITYATIDSLNALSIEVDTMSADMITADYIEANYATIVSLNSVAARITVLEATEVTTDYLSANYLSANQIAVTYATITNLNSATARIDTLEANQMSVDYLQANYAETNLSNINSGCITTAMIANGAISTAQIADASITSAKIVSIVANQITAGTLSVERLIISGNTSSIVYAINNMGSLESTTVNSIDGYTLTPRTITADKIVANSITANEIAANVITANEIASNAITAVKISSGAITAVKIATGAITTDKLAAGAVTAVKINVTDLFAQDIVATGSITGVDLIGATGSFTGSVTATSGSIGGMTLSSNAIYYGTGSMTSTTAGIYLGTSGFRQYSSATAYCNIQNGILTAKGVDITGKITASTGTIGGMTLASNAIYSGTNSMTSTVSGIYLGTGGFRQYSNANAYCNIQGGILTAKGADITGKINSSSGTIGGMTLVSNAIYSGTSGMTSTTAGIYLGTDGFRQYSNANAYCNIQGGVLTARGANITGTVTATSGTFTGTINAIGGQIGTTAGKTWIIGGNATRSWIYNRRNAVDDSTSKGVYLGTNGIAVCGDPTSTSFWGDNVTTKIRNSGIEIQPLAGMGLAKLELNDEGFFDISMTSFDISLSAPHIVISAGSLIPDGDTVDLGLETERWSTVYTKGLNVSGTTAHNGHIYIANNCYLYMNNAGNAASLHVMGINTANNFMCGATTINSFFRGATIYFQSGNNNIACVNSTGIVPTVNNGYNLGSSSYKWNYIYSAHALQTSDRNLKTDIAPIDKKYVDMAMDLKPSTYKLIGEDKTQVGLIAQEVEEVALKHNLSIDDCGFIGKDKDLVDDKYYYSLDYSFVGVLCVAKIQDHETRIKDLENELAITKAIVSNLQVQALA